MADDTSVDPAGWFAEQIGACEPALLRSMVKTVAEALISAGQRGLQCRLRRTLHRAGQSPQRVPGTDVG